MAKILSLVACYVRDFTIYVFLMLMISGINVHLLECQPIRPAAIYLSLCTLVYSFSDDNLSKYQWNFTILGICIDIVEICFGVANGQIHQLLTDLSASNSPCFYFQMITRIKVNRFSPNMVCALILWRSGL